MLLFVDRMTLDGSPRRTNDGYLVASPKVARTGIQDYAGFEVGKPDMERVRVFRPEEEVFSKDAMISFAHRPITVDHPPELVDADNWKKYARGTTGGDIVRDKDFIVVPMALMDKEAIDDVEKGKRELSMGYTADLDFTAGIDPNSGEHYDAVQRNIRGNHLAIVDAARGGRELRVYDTATPTTSKQEPKPMSLKTILVDGINVEVTDTAHQVMTKFLKDMEEEKKGLDEKIKELEDELAELKAKKDEDKETKDAEIATLKQQLDEAKLTPEKLDEAVKVRDGVIQAARSVMPEIVVDKKTDAEIRRAVVDHRMGEAAKGWSDEAIAASFNTLTASSGDKYVQNHRQQPVIDTSNVKHLEQYDQRLSNAWKNPSAKEA